jgi:hypothetical protein
MVVGTSILITLGGPGVALAGTAGGGELGLDLSRDCPLMYDHIIVPGYEDPTWVECTRILQTDLNTIGTNVAVDGYYGTATSRAVARFQDEFGLHESNGNADQQTRLALQNDARRVIEQADYNANASTDAVCGFGGAIGSTICSIVTKQDPAN